MYKYMIDIQVKPETKKREVNEAILTALQMSIDDSAIVTIEYKSNICREYWLNKDWPSCHNDSL